MVHQSGGFDNPGIAGIGLGVVPFLSSINGALLLCLADEDHTFAVGVLGAHFGGDFILSPSPLESDERNLILLSELLNGRYKRSGHRLDGIGGKYLGVPLVADKVERAFQDLEPSHEDVQVHAVDGFDFQINVLFQHFGHGLW